MKKVFTLCIVHNNTHVLLGLKKRGFGAGKWNGFGGKVEEGETIAEAARRELVEEAGITPLDLQKRGVFNFVFEGDPTTLEVHVFGASKFEGSPCESDEMKPEWFERTNIPFYAMWADDKHWLPLFLQGKNLNGTFLYKDPDTLLTHELKEV